jgi:hypothetical protein
MEQMTKIEALEYLIKNKMEFQINRANIEKLTWSNDTLRIYFTTGQIVAYQNVPEGIAVGMAQAPSAGSYQRLYIVGKYSYVVEKQSELKEQNTKLLHHKDTTVGLWATDRPDLIPESVKDLFFQITFDETEVVLA